MAEFCIECLNKDYSEKEKLKEKDVITAFDFCEECGQWKPCVIRFKKRKIFIYRLKMKLSIIYSLLFIKKK